jgi:hypothetical protein
MEILQLAVLFRISSHPSHIPVRESSRQQQQQCVLHPQVQLKQERQCVSSFGLEVSFELFTALYCVN